MHLIEKREEEFVLINRKKTFGYSGKFLKNAAAFLQGSTAQLELASWPVEATVQRKQSAAISVTPLEGRGTVALLQLHGPLDAGSYLDLIAQTRELYKTGARYIIFDMSHVSRVGLSSMLALHSISLILRGEEPLDPEVGWETLRTVARDLESSGLQKNFKLLRPEAKVEAVLTQAGFKNFLEIHTDLETAVASFPVS